MVGPQEIVKKALRSSPLPEIGPAACPLRWIRPLVARSCAVAAFAANVGIELVGEGVEREEEMRTLINLWVRYGQGLFIGRPESLNAD
jgi:hypothetical protein